MSRTSPSCSRRSPMWCTASCAQDAGSVADVADRVEPGLRDTTGASDAGATGASDADGASRHEGRGARDPVADGPGARGARRGAGGRGPRATAGLEPDGSGRPRGCRRGVGQWHGGRQVRPRRRRRPARCDHPAPAVGPSIEPTPYRTCRSFTTTTTSSWSTTTGVAAHPSVGWSGRMCWGAAGSGLPDHHVRGERGGWESSPRLDVGTSGLMVVAKASTATAASSRLSVALGRQDHHTLVQGLPDPLSGHHRRAHRAAPGHDYKFAVMDSGRHSVTTTSWSRPSARRPC